MIIMRIVVAIIEWLDDRRIKRVMKKAGFSNTRITRRERG